MPSKLWQFRGVPIKCSNQFSYYIEFICRRAYQIKILVWVSSHGWFPGLQSLDVFGKLTAELLLKSLSGRNKSLEVPPFFFSNGLPYDLEESKDLRTLIRHSKVRKISVKLFFFAFLSCHYGFTTCFKILNFVFSNIPSEVSTCKILTF